MDENIVFRSPDETIKQPEVLVGNPIIPPVPESLPSEASPSILAKILKIFLGITIILIIIYVVLNFVLPKFFPSVSNKVTLTYWGLFEDPLVIAPIISDFEKGNPNIKIIYFKQDIADQYRERLITRSNIGNGPDVFGFHNSWVPMLTSLLLPLPVNVISKEDFIKNYYPVAAKDLIRAGVIYGIPSYMDALSLYVNNDLFKAAGLKPPTTWIEFANDSRQLTVKDKDNNIKTSGVAMGTYNNINHAPDIISMLFAQNGVNLNNISANSATAADALSFYSSFANSSSGVWDNTLDSSVEMFSSGSLAMYFGYSWDFFTIKSINPNLSFNIVPVPNLPGQNATIASYWAEGVSVKSRFPKEALLFMKYLARKEVQQKLFAEESKVKNFGKPYSRVDLADSLRNSIVYPFVSSAQFAVSSFFIDGTYDNGLNFQANTILGNAVNSMLEGTSPQSAVDALSQGVTQILKQYGQ